jgi:hypothetical protein
VRVNWVIIENIDSTSKILLKEDPFSTSQVFFFLSLESDNDVEKTNYSFCENLSPKAQAVVSKNRGIGRELLGFLSFLSRRRIMFQM